MAVRIRAEEDKNSRRLVAMTIFVIMTSCLAKAAANDAGESRREDDVDGSARFKRGQSIGNVECQYRCSSNGEGGGEQVGHTAPAVNQLLQVLSATCLLMAYAATNCMITLSTRFCCPGCC